METLNEGVSKKKSEKINQKIAFFLTKSLDGIQFDALLGRGCVCYDAPSFSLKTLKYTKRRV